jgi:hypothetical protein
MPKPLPVLESCPFCGGVGVLESRCGDYYVICDNCSVEGPMADSVELARLRWNTRYCRHCAEKEENGYDSGDTVTWGYAEEKVTL